ncbi:LCP family protein [Herbivorax sp. ANBcel31]|uniref:LCP family protein n=1 Tax=Herbivorax sp. ANBcel31 TaxID=3069754 RepID=UPI0027AF62AA|nr:LCP family protein [Herbivorax sp. ANBcel31]MDQ2086082.1 LCP family protein [Herbivorax sp. ANBcel31]
MRFRRNIFYICIVFSFVLFFEGIFTLYNFDENSKTNFKRERTNNYEKTQIMRDIFGEKEDYPEYINLLLMGLDESEKRSDGITLINFQPQNGNINMLSIARDTMIKLNSGRTLKINALIGLGGESKIIEKVEELTDMPVHYYLTMNFEGFREIIDLLGGVEIDVPFNMEYDDPYQNLYIRIDKGKQILDGEKAEKYLRYRKGNRAGEGYEDGDIGRIKAQQKFIGEFINQKLKLKYFHKANDIFFIIKNNVTTNIELADVNYYLNVIKDINIDELKVFTLPGHSEYINNQYYYINDESKTRDIINNNFN